MSPLKETRSPRSTARDVFINCPFDGQYREQFNALLFTVFDCGFYPRCALESDDAGELRFAKICRLIRECRYGIHDLSRVELGAENQLPRFNMPLELGLFLGAKEFSENKARVCLVMDSERYRYQIFCSDLAGVDISAHEDDTQRLVCVVRDWLRTNQENEEQIPGGSHIFQRYQVFLSALPELCLSRYLDHSALPYRDLRSLLEGWLKGNDWRPSESEAEPPASERQTP